MILSPSDLRENVNKICQPSSDFCLELLTGCTSHVDAIEYVQEAVVRENYPAEDQPEAYVLSRFGHISVNPHDPYNTEILKTSYAYSGSSRAYSSEGCVIVNRNAKVAEEFVNLLSTAALVQRSLSLGTGGLRDATFINNRFFVLTGERGVGKTYFLNHILSTHGDDLDTKKIVWVRLNLVPNRGFDRDLEHWILSQIAKILIRYYEKTSEYTAKTEMVRCEFLKYLRGWIEKISEAPLTKRALHDQLLQMQMVFAIRGSDRQIAPTLCNVNICTELFRYAREVGYSFIVVLDGFDRLDIDYYHRIRFDDIKSQVLQLLSGYERNGYALLVVARTNSFASVTATNPYLRLSGQNKFLIEDVSIEQIVDRRKECIVQELQNRSRDISRSFAVRNWAADLAEFSYNLYNNKDGYFGELNSAFIHNTRAKMHLIQLLLQEFLQSKTGQGYRMLEHMIKAGSSYPPLFYRYRKEESGLAVELGDDALYDSRYLPVITRPPIPMNDNGTLAPEGYYNWASPIHGIRILQVAQAYGALVSRDRSMDNATAKEISEILKELFDYPEPQTMAFLRELDSFEVLRIINTGTLAFDSEMVRVIPLPKVRYLFERCIPDIAYLNLCAMRTPMCAVAFEKGIFRAVRISNPRTSLQSWVSAKITNALFLVALLSSVNERQLKIVEHDKRILSLRGRKRSVMEFCVSGGMFKIFVNLANKVNLELSNILHSAQPDAVARLDLDDLSDQIIEVRDRLEHVNRKP